MPAAFNLLPAKAALCGQALQYSLTWFSAPTSQSSAVFRTLEMPWAYSGLAISTPSACGQALPSVTPCLQGSACAASSAARLYDGCRTGPIFQPRLPPRVVSFSGHRAAFRPMHPIWSPRYHPPPKSACLICGRSVVWLLRFWC